MKKPPLCLLVFALSAPAWSNTTLPNLTFKNVMDKLYTNQTTACPISADTHEALQGHHYTCLKERHHGDRMLAVMHPVVSFANQAKQPRHLLMIEKIALDSEGDIFVGHSLGAKVDFYLFKNTTQGHELINQNTDGEEVAGSWGRTDVDLKQVKQSLQPLGKNLMGGLFESGYCSTGSCEMTWQALLLPDTGKMGVAFVAQAGADNEGSYEKTDPQYYSHQSTYKVIKNGADHYPIEVHYTGTELNDRQKIHKVNQKITFTFNPKEYSYQQRP